MSRFRVLGLVCVVGLVACEAVTSVALEATDFAGAKADAHCDRRFVTDGGKPASFCQEIVGTVAASEFADDCRQKHAASAGPGACSRDGIIAGCKLLEKHDDNSVVWDWYYEASSVDGGSAGFENAPRSVDEVAATCADPSRYDQGAELARP